MRQAALVLFLLSFLTLPALAEDEDEGPAPAPPAPPPRQRPGGAWERIQRWDANGDGVVTRDEFQGPDRIFDRLDGDGDDTITEEEAAAMGRGSGRGGPPGGGGMPGRGRTRGATLERLDTNGDGTIGRTEWDDFFKQADENEDGILQAEEWEAAVGGGPLRDPAPQVGAAAPQVSAADLETGRTIDLGSPSRTTVLIFGSHT